MDRDLPSDLHLFEKALHEQNVDPAPSTKSLRPNTFGLNLRDYGRGLQVEGKGSVRYTGDETDAGAIQTLQSVSVACKVHYYELQVLNKGERGCISLGYANSVCKLNRPCG